MSRVAVTVIGASSVVSGKPGPTMIVAGARRVMTVRDHGLTFFYLFYASCVAVYVCFNSYDGSVLAKPMTAINFLRAVLNDVPFRHGNIRYVPVFSSSDSSFNVYSSAMLVPHVMREYSTRRTYHAHLPCSQHMYPS